MLYRVSVVLGGTVLALVGLVGGGPASAGASLGTPTNAAVLLGGEPAPAVASPGAPANAAAPAVTATPAPPMTCPPALPISGAVDAVTPTSVTISYSMLLTPPCGYNPPVTVTLFASREDAQQWQNPVAAAVSGPERYGKVTLDGLTPDTPYWFRFTADGHRDPYVIGSARTAPVAVCTATAQIDSAWSGGFVARITVRNVATETLDAWRVSWRWSGDEQIRALWGGVAQGDAPDVTVVNAPYNGNLPPDGSTTFGLLVATSASPPSPIALTCGR